jgi:predicted nuclease of restriction endonuclease-like (RecB) superfamily
MVNILRIVDCYEKNPSNLRTRSLVRVAVYDPFDHTHTIPFAPHYTYQRKRIIRPMRLILKLTGLYLPFMLRAGSTVRLSSYMKKHSKQATLIKGTHTTSGYDAILSEIVELLESARRASVRTINALMTATYWEIGRRVVEFEQSGKQRAPYAEGLLKHLSVDLTAKFGRGFSVDNLETMRLFYTSYPAPNISETVSRISNGEATPVSRFPLSWSHYVMLVRRTRSPEARVFYETEALRGGWSVRQLDRQISTLFYERTALSRNKAAMLTKGAKAKPEDAITPEEELKNPMVLEFLDLKDEYSENQLEEALIRHLEAFLLELGGDFAFIGRQKRLRIGDQWFRVDLIFFHRRLRCLVIIDLKVGKFTHADAGQMHMYLNYARHHWTYPDENPPVGLILSAEKNAAVARYALEGLPNKILAAEYRTTLPEEKILTDELERTRRILEDRSSLKKQVKKKG